ncbi:MAG: type II toxin-antitoxin system VapC family toxin [Proteobacteria bacterium]|nr:type II toxin-antitoxin system VapC family toxin [Pseudomonadota bacterium]
MIVDSSAVIAILRLEVDARTLFETIRKAPSVAMSTATFFETAIVIDSRRDPAISRELDDFCENIALKFIPVDEKQMRIAREAYRDFGKGSRHKAQLNFGDCFTYALAKATGEPLLYKGRDFVHTDVASALD